MKEDAYELPAGRSLPEHIDTVRKVIILKAVDRAGGEHVRAAEILGIPLRSFRYYAKKYNLLSRAGNEASR